MKTNVNLTGATNLRCCIDGSYQVELEDEHKEDDNGDEDGRLGSRREQSSPAGSDDENRSHRNRYRRDSSDNIESTAQSGSGSAGARGNTIQGNHGGHTSVPYGRQPQSQPYNQQSSFPGNNGPGGRMGRFQNKHYRPDTGRGSYAGAVMGIPPGGPVSNQLNDSASYNPYAGNMFPGLATSVGFPPAALPPYGWMPEMMYAPNNTVGLPGSDIAPGYGATVSASGTTAGAPLNPDAAPWAPPSSSQVGFVC
jgi:hypothetical protein